MVSGWLLSGVTLRARALGAPVAGWTPSIRYEDDPDFPCRDGLVQLHLIGQEQRAALHQGVWHSADRGANPLGPHSLVSVCCCAPLMMWTDVFQTAVNYFLGSIIVCACISNTSTYIYIFKPFFKISLSLFTLKNFHSCVLFRVYLSMLVREKSLFDTVLPNSLRSSLQLGR